MTNETNVKFESLGAALHDINTRPARADWDQSALMSQRIEGDNRPLWSGTKDFAGAVHLAQNGWIEGRDNMLSALTGTIQQIGGLHKAPAIYLDVAGAYPIAALAAAGETFNMVNLSPVSDRARPVVRLAFSGFVSSAYKPEYIRNYGAALLAYVEALEVNDYQCELTYVMHAKDRAGAQRGTFSVVFKAAGEVLDIDRCAFMLTCPAMFRRIDFAIMERYFPPSFQASYGTPSTLVRGKHFDEDQILLPSIQTINPDDKVLKSPKLIMDKIAPVIDALLADRFADFPPLWAE